MDIMLLSIGIIAVIVLGCFVLFAKFYHKVEQATS